MKVKKNVWPTKLAYLGFCSIFAALMVARFGIVPVTVFLAMAVLFLAAAVVMKATVILGKRNKLADPAANS